MKSFVLWMIFIPLLGAHPINATQLSRSCTSLALSSWSDSADESHSVAEFCEEENKNFCQSNKTLTHYFSFCDARTLVLKIRSIENRVDEYIPFDNGVRAPFRNASGFFISPSIKNLKLRGPWVCDRAIMPFSSKLTGLVSLDLEGCNLISAEGLIRLASYSEGLISLNLRRCKRITDAGLFHLLQYFARLTRIDLRDCHSLSTEYQRVFGEGEIAELKERLKTEQATVEPDPVIVPKRKVSESLSENLGENTGMTCGSFNSCALQ